MCYCSFYLIGTYNFFSFFCLNFSNFLTLFIVTHASTIPHLMIHSRYRPRPLEDLWNMSCWKYRIMSDYCIDWAPLWLMRALAVTMVTHSSVYLKLCRKSSGRKHLFLCYLNFMLTQLCIFCEKESAFILYHATNVRFRLQIVPHSVGSFFL